MQSTFRPLYRPKSKRAPACCAASGFGSEHLHQLFIVDPLTAWSTDRTRRERTATPRSPRQARRDSSDRLASRRGRRASIRLGRQVRPDARRSEGWAVIRERPGCRAGGAGHFATGMSVSDIDAPLIRIDPRIMDGTPVFVGSRLPGANRLGREDAGNSWERIVASWPFLTPAHADTARPVG